MEIQSTRFILRDFTEADHLAFAAYHADPRLLAFFGLEQASPDLAEQRLAKFAAWATQQPRFNYQLAVFRRHEVKVEQSGGSWFSERGWHGVVW